MEHIPQIIDSCNQLVITWGDQVFRHKWADFWVGFGIVGTLLVVFPAVGLGIWRFGVYRKWW